MKKLLSLFVASFLLSNVAFAEVVAKKTKKTSAITDATEYELTVTGNEPTSKEVADEVAERIRQSYHIRGATIDSWSLVSVKLSSAIKNLGKEDGKFEGISDRDFERLSSWIEDKLVQEKAYKMTVTGNYMGADGESVHYIFLPTDYMDPVLTIGYDRISEE